MPVTLDDAIASHLRFSASLEDRTYCLVMTPKLLASEGCKTGQVRVERRAAISTAAEEESIVLAM